MNILLIVEELLVCLTASVNRTVTGTPLAGKSRYGSYERTKTFLAQSQRDGRSYLMNASSTTFPNLEPQKRGCLPACEGEIEVG